ncbi:MAG: hypothetical protein HPZ91_08580 [Lentisphaeria bacterium]|nr:hypothetical protein [Lentisphaeria bacterium]
MTLSAFLLVLVSVFLHAGWNFLSKRQIPSLAFYSLTSSTAALLWLPGFLLSDLRLAKLPGTFWPVWIGSLCFEYLYVYGLAHAYRKDDICLVYPLTRALPVMMTALLTLLFGLGTPPGPTALAGMVILSAGCVLMPLMRWNQFRLASYRSGALKFIAIAAAGTTGYTILDSIAIRQVRSAVENPGLSCSIAYLFLIEAGLAALLLAAVAVTPAERAEFSKLFLKTKIPVISGIFSSSAYILILLAMARVSNVSYIQAFRQMSLPLGVLAGIFLLHEKPGKPRLAGIALVILGLVIIGLGK